jgi:FdrA protein
MIKVGQYYDSVSLMLVARELSQMQGISDAAVVMATEANKGILQQAGMLTAEANAASPNDLVIAVSGATEALDRSLAEAEKLLTKKQAAHEGGAFRPKTLRGAVKTDPAANVAVISVAGRYAADEAWDALHAGLHVLLFSDNVSLEDEIALKRYAVDNGLLLMGPGAGTAILNGVALGFANVVPRGPVGIVSAAGTGLQEVSTLLAKAGVGITQGIGTGGRDLKGEVGALMMLAGLQALQADPDTQVILLVSKPPAEAVAKKVLEQVACSDKPTVVCLLGGELAELTSPKHKIARTLEEAASLAASFALAGSGESRPAEKVGPTVNPAALRRQLAPGQRYLRGLFSGGTLCYEAQVIWRDLLPVPVLSNAPLSPGQQLPDSNRSQGHSAVDLGEEEFTVGRPHPMIDNDLRIRRMLQEAGDPEVAVLLLDVVLGYGAHPDPAGELVPAIQRARRLASDGGRGLIVIASVTGTEEDPQRLSAQVAALERGSVIVCPSNAAAARLAAAIVG